MTAFRIGFAAWALLTASLFAATRADRTHRSNCNPVGSRLVGHVRRIHGVPALPCADLRALVEDAHGERRPRPEGASRRHHPGLLEARSAAHLHERRYRLRLRQQVEAALLHEGRRRLLSAPRAVGRHAPHWRPYIVQPTPIGGSPYYPADNMQAADRSAVRRLPLGELQRPDQDRHGVERRLREMPRPGQRARRAARRARTSSTRRGSIRRANDTCIQCHSQGQPLTTRSTAATTTGRSASTSD